MSLAQVVYNISTDVDFAEKFRSDPETTLAKKGWKLSKEEKAFLVTSLKGTDAEKVHLTRLRFASPWYGV